MTNAKVIKALKKFKNASKESKFRKRYLSVFKKKMAYRTTKSENPEITMKMVEKVFKK